MNLKSSLIWRGLALLMLAVVTTSHAWANTPDMTSRWVAQGIKIDGQRSDWPENAVGFLSEQEATVGLCNDSDNVYVMLSFKKAQYARMIRMSGLTIWLDDKGGKGKTFMVRFTGGPTREQMQGVMEESGRDSSRQTPPEMRQRMGERDRKVENKLVCFQKDNIAEKEIPLDGSEGPAGAFGVEKGFFTYEFSIPLKASALRHYGLGLPPGPKIGIGLIWGEMDKSKMGEGKGEGRASAAEWEAVVAKVAECLREAAWVVAVAKVAADVPVAGVDHAARCRANKRSG